MLVSRRVRVHYQAEIDDVIKDTLRNNVIQPSQSPWAGPVLLVQKEDGLL